MSHEDSWVRRIARLAGLNLNDCEIDQFENDLTDMVGFVQRINRITLKSVDDEPVSPSPLRRDASPPDTDCGGLFGPGRTDEEGYLIVPPVLGEDT